jgi:predicted metal-binding membrane protein
VAGGPAVSRALTILGLVAIAALSWAWIAPMAVDMYGSMTGLSAWMMTAEWTAGHVFLLWLMWAVMMAAMMLPSAMPLLFFYDRALRRQPAAGHAAGLVYAMAAGYLLVWAGFSAGATALQRVLTSVDVVDAMMEMRGRPAVALTLVVAGFYQFTPWKSTCLSHCRSPLSFITTRWRRGAGGALRMGLEHGTWCLGCCWALMLLLFAGGVMNLTVIVGLAILVLVEKLAPFGAAASRVLGGVLIVAGAWVWFV